ERATAQHALRREGLGRIDTIGDEKEQADVERDANEQNGVVDELGAVPLDGAETDAHRVTSAACGAAGGARKPSPSARPSPTASASSGHSARWTVRCERLMACGRLCASG